MDNHIIIVVGLTLKHSVDVLRRVTYKRESLCTEDIFFLSLLPALDKDNICLLEVMLIKCLEIF